MRRAVVADQGASDSTEELKKSKRRLRPSQDDQVGGDQDRSRDSQAMNQLWYLWAGGRMDTAHTFRGMTVGSPSEMETKCTRCHLLNHRWIAKLASFVRNCGIHRAPGGSYNRKSTEFFDYARRAICCSALTVRPIGSLGRSGSFLQE